MRRSRPLPTPSGQLAAAYNPPQGSFTWESGYPSELQAFWQNGSLDEPDPPGRGDGLRVRPRPGHRRRRRAGGLERPAQGVAANQDNTHGYTYALASEGNPETLTVWHDGRVILQTLANTGIAAAPTTLGTAPVYLKYYFQIMKGKNPDGSKYADPVYYVSYFRSGEAVHYFPRGSYGYQQSLGCVELPWSRPSSSGRT